MIKSLISVGNSRAIILPTELIQRYGLKDVSIEATDQGILLRPVVEKTSFQKKMEALQDNKTAINKQIEKEANNPKTIAYYNNSNNTFDGVDTDIIEP